MKKLLLTLLSTFCIFTCNDALAKNNNRSVKKQKEKLEAKRAKKNKEKVEELRKKIAEYDERLSKLSPSKKAPFNVRDERAKLLKSKASAESRLKRYEDDLKDDDKKGKKNKTTDKRKKNDE